MPNSLDGCCAAFPLADFPTTSRKPQVGLANAFAPLGKPDAAPPLNTLEVSASTGDLVMALESHIAIPHVGRERDATVLYFTGRHLTLDEPVLTRIRDMLSALAQYQQREKVIIDFNNVDFIFSPAL